MNAPYPECVVCQEVITNPLCADCLGMEMKVMLAEHDPRLGEVIAQCNIEGDTQCIKCQRKMGLCAHCFSRDMYEYLVEVNPSVAKEFMGRFDFDLRKDFL